MVFPARRALFIGILAVALSAPAAGNESVVTIRAVARGNPAMPSHVTLRMQSSTGTREIILQSGEAHASAPAGSEWTLSTAAPELWTLPQRLTFPPTGMRAETQVELWPAASLTGTVSASDASKPDLLTVSIESPPHPSARPEIPRGTIATCPIGESGRWTCVIPATKLDLVLRVKGMTPHYVWNVTATPAQRKDLGAFRLRPGASFVGYVDRRIAEEAKKPVKARLVRPVAQVASETAARLSVPVAEGVFDKRGWLQLAPVPPGSYLLEVEAEGYARTSVGPIEIYEGKESAFRKLIELAPPVHLVIAIEPPTNVDGAPWNVAVTPLGAFAPASGAGTRVRTDPAGIATVKDQVPGLFAITIADAARNAIWSGDVRVTGESDSRIPIALDLKTVAGLVTLGDDPLPAVLWFGRRDGAVRVRMEADAEGRFHGRLPRHGKWPVEIVSTSPAIRTVFDADVESGKELRLSVPDTSLSGRVLAEDGAPATRAMVSVMTTDHAFEAPADANGEFQLRGLPAGSVRLLATDRSSGASSAAVTIRMQEQTRHEPVELRIAKMRKITGTVISGGQPVVGASVAVTGIDVAGMVRETITDLAGTFNASIPASAKRAQFIVSAPNRTLQPFELAVAEAPVVLDVAPVGGTLEITSAGAAGPRLAIRHNGASIPLQAVFTWLSAHGQPLTDSLDLTIPDLAPGHYQVCAASGCNEGMLAPRGTLRLQAGR